MTQEITFSHQVINRIMPMFVTMDSTGMITDIGHTLEKLLDDKKIIGQQFLDVFDFRRPCGIKKFSQIDAAIGGKIVLNPQYGIVRRYPGLIVKLQGDQGYFVNLSLGPSLFRVMENCLLSSKDFPPTDQSIDMMYMVELQAVVHAASRGLHNRLNGAKHIAEKQAFSDPLTGLSNRRALTNFLARMIARNDGHLFSLVSLDLDLFKSVNDTYGHAAGDCVLRDVAQKLIMETRPLDMVARIGGDEFVIILPRVNQEDDLKSFCTRIITSISKPTMNKGAQYIVGASIGAVISSCRDDNRIDQILQMADDGLYQSKLGGRGIATVVNTITNVFEGGFKQPNR